MTEIAQEAAAEYVLVTALYLNAMLLKENDLKIIADLTVQRLQDKGVVCPSEAMLALCDVAKRMSAEFRRSGCGPRCQCG